MLAGAKHNVLVDAALVITWSLQDVQRSVCASFHLILDSTSEQGRKRMIRLVGRYSKCVAGPSTIGPLWLMKYDASAQHSAYHARLLSGRFPVI